MQNIVLELFYIMYTFILYYKQNYYSVASS